MPQKLLLCLFILIFLTTIPISTIASYNPTPNIGVRWLIEPSLELTFVYDFQGGMAAVEIMDDNWYWSTVGYINNLGEFVIPIQYRNQRWRSFHNFTHAPLHFGYGAAGIFSAENNESVAFFSTSGEQLTPFVFAAAQNFSEGLAAVAIRLQHGNNEAEPEYRWGFVDTTGELVIPFTFEAVGHFSEGLAAVLFNGYWGFIDTGGNLVIPFSIYSLSSTTPWAINNSPFFSEGRAIVWEWDTDEYYTMPAWQRQNWFPGRKYGVIDREGNQITPFIYDSISHFSEGRAAIRVSTDYGPTWGFIDLYGNEIIPPIFGWAQTFSNGLAQVMHEDNLARWTGRSPWVTSFIDRYGNVVIEQPAEVQHFGSNFSEGLLPFVIDGRFGFMDKTGAEIIPPAFSWVDHNGFSNGLIWVGAVREGVEELGGFGFHDVDFGFIDTTGNTVVPIVFDQVNTFSEGLAWVMYDGYWGILQVVTGEEAYNLPPLYIPQRAEPEYVAEYATIDIEANDDITYSATTEYTTPTPPERAQRPSMSRDTLRTWIIIVLSFAGVAAIGFGTGVTMLRKLEDGR